MTRDWHIKRAVRALANDGIVAHPAEGVWGLACNPESKTAVQRLLQLKGRPQAKGLILVAATAEKFSPWLDLLPVSVSQKIKTSWPGACTWIVPDYNIAPPWITGTHSTVALRVPGNIRLRQLAHACNGYLVSTSANPSGHRPALSSLRVHRYFGSRLQAIVPASGSLSGQVSTVIEALTDRVIRANNRAQK